MASYDEVKLEDILHGTFATFNPNTGANKNADSLPTIVVYEETGSSPMSTGNVTNMTIGRYRWQVSVAAASGFEQGKFYDVWASGTVTGTDTVSQAAPIMSFKATSSVVDDLATPTNITSASGIIVTTINNDAITSNSIAASALNGKGDWNTVVPPAATGISSQVMSDLASAHGTGLYITATGFSTHAAADVLTAFGTGSTLTYLAPASTALSTGVWTATKAGYLDTTIGSRMATYTQPTGFLAATFPTTVASTTNITAANGVTLTATTGLGNQTANITGSLSGTVGGIAGTITTLDALDTAQDTQHTTTQGLVTTVDTVVDAIKVKTDFLPSATAGASGGVIIVGTNSAAVEFTAGVTISSTTGDALALTSTGGDGVGLVATGNGGGAGIRGAGGATGPGILGIGGATSGAGIRGTGQNNSQGIVGLGEGSGAGIQGTGGLTGPGMWAYGGATSGDGIKANGNGTGVDIRGDIVGNVTGTVSGNSTHDAAAVLSALGTGSTLTYLAPASTALSTGVWTATKAGYLDGSILSRMASYTQPAGFLAAIFPAYVADSGGSTGLDASGVRAAVGLASANLDAQLSGIPNTAAFEARTLPSGQYFDPATDTVINVTNVASLSGITAAANTILYNNVVAIKSTTDQMVFTTPNQLNVNAFTITQSGIRSAVGLASANLDTQLDSIATAINAGDLATKTADTGIIITGTEIGGTYASTYTDDNIHWNVAPVSPAESGYGLRTRLQFDLPLGRICTQLQIRGQWSGPGSVVNVFAYNTRTEVYDQLTNTNTNMGSRGSETLYAITIPIDYIDTTSGISNTVLIEFRAINTSTSNRLRIDRALLYHVDEEAPFTMTAPTINDIWSAPSRTLTDLGSEPSAAPTVSEIASGVWQEVLSTHSGVSGSSAEYLTLSSGIKVKTDQLTFSSANQLDVKVYGVAETGFRDIFETYTLTESYPASGAIGTPAQSYYMIQQGFLDFGIVGTTITVRKLDGSDAATFIMNSSGTPTSRTRGS
jgi:hypothetical protein